MAVTNVVSGSLSLALTLRRVASGDESGTVLSQISETRNFGATASLPETIEADGYLYGTVVAAAGDWLLAHASDPFQGMGDATYSGGFAPAGKKVKAICIVNNDTANSVTLTPKTGNPFLLLGAAGDLITIQPGGVFLLTIPEGSAALTTTTNDGITVAVEGGTPSLEVLIAYGD
jgi:hypothetical protein